MENKKGQFAVEFMIIIGVMFLIFLGFTAIITNKILEAKEIERMNVAESLGKLANISTFDSVVYLKKRKLVGTMIPKVSAMIIKYSTAD